MTTRASRFCSLANLGTFTDLASNAVVLPQFEMSEDVPRMANGTLPLEYLPDLVHEMTHHYCFCREVPRVLAALKGRRTEQDMLEDFPSPASIAQRYQAAESILRPLAEGLALFSEFDARPSAAGKGPIFFKPLLGLFRKRATEAPGVLATDVMASLLLESRMKVSMFARKEDLLCRGFDTSRGGYLPGYMMVKGAWNAYRTAVRDADAMIFLSYAISFFFDDFALIEKILRPDCKNLKDDVQELVDYVGFRLISFRFEGPIEENASTFGLGMSREWLNEPKSWLVGCPPPGLMVDEDLELQGYRRATQLGDWLEARARKGDIAAISEMLLSMQRDILCVASQACHVQITDSDVNTFVDGSHYWGPGEAVAGQDDGEGDGFHALYYSYIGNVFFLATTIKGSVVHIAFEQRTSAIPHLDKLEEALVSSARLDTGRTLQMQETLDACFEKYLTLIPELDDWLSTVSKYGVESADLYYGMCALGTTDNEPLSAIRARMKENGFWDILQKDSDAVHALSIVSTLRSAGLADGQIRDALQQHGHEPDARLSELRTALRDFAFGSTLDLV